MISERAKFGGQAADVFGSETSFNASGSVSGSMNTVSGPSSNTAAQVLQILQMKGLLD